MSVDMVHFDEGFVEVFGEHCGDGFADDEGTGEAGVGGDGDEVGGFDGVSTDVLEDGDDFFAMEARGDFGQHPSVFLVVGDLGVGEELFDVKGVSFVGDDGEGGIVAAGFDGEGFGHKITEDWVKITEPSQFCEARILGDCRRV